MCFHGRTNSESRINIRSILTVLFLSGFASLAASSFQSLESGVDARSASMGFTHIAMRDYPVAGFGNPAALLQAPVRTVSFSMNNWIQDMQSGTAGLVVSGEKSAFGLSLYYSEIGDIEHRITATETPIGTFASHDFVMGFGYARKVVSGVSIGVTLRSYYQKIYLDDAWGAGGGLGVMWSFPDNKTRIGGAVQHLGKSGALRDESLDLPATIRFGASRLFGLGKVKGQVQVDAVQEKDAPFHLHAGVELGWIDFFNIRAGYLSGYETRDITFGLGFSIQKYRLDYAYVPFKSGLGDVHLFSVLFHW